MKAFLLMRIVGCCSLSHYSYIITPIMGIGKDAAGREKGATL